MHITWRLESIKSAMPAPVRRLSGVLIGSGGIIFAVRADFPAVDLLPWARSTPEKIMRDQ